MKLIDLKKRFITSIPLLLILCLSFFYSYVLIFSLILLSLISLVEFKKLIFKIFKNNFYKLAINLIFLIYLIIFSSLVFYGISQQNLKINMLFLFSICVFSDVGGLLFGKIFKGKKLTKISPNKTISGSIGSFLLSLLLVPIFYFFHHEKTLNVYSIILIVILVSFICQLGDLFISFLKRKAKVKDTGDILPGHGGLLDRIDGMLFAIPVGIIISNFLLIDV